MKNVIKIIYGLVKVLPLVGEILEILTTRKKDTDNSPVVKSDKDILNNV